MSTHLKNIMNRTRNILYSLFLIPKNSEYEIYSIGIQNLQYDLFLFTFFCYFCLDNNVIHIRNFITFYLIIELVFPTLLPFPYAINKISIN